MALWVIGTNNSLAFCEHCGQTFTQTTMSPQPGGPVKAGRSAIANANRHENSCYERCQGECKPAFCLNPKIVEGSHQCPKHKVGHSPGFGCALCFKGKPAFSIEGVPK